MREYEQLSSAGRYRRRREAVVFIWAAVIATLLSGLDYLWRYRRFVI